VSSRPRRALLGLVAGIATLAVLPATALAAGETMSVTPTNTQAGGGTNVTATLNFDPTDTPATVVTSLAPGILANLNANASCLIGSQQLTTSCQIGTASVGTDGAGTFAGNLYLVPAATGSSDSSGIEFVSTPPLSNQYIGVTLNPNAPGGLNLTTTFPNPGPARITSFTANFTTLNGQEFTRLPSSCSVATSSFSSAYYGGTPTGSASNSFTPTGCASETYAPALSATITKDAHDSGAGLVLGITQGATDSANKTIVLALPKGLTPNVGADASCLNATGCQIGTATATSPLVPSVALANGKVNLTASGTTPTISVAFPAPFAITLNGVVDLNNNTVTFSNVPDVPLTALNLNVGGPNGQKAFNTDCAQASVGGAFTAQSGATKNVASAITFVDCAVKPTVTGSTSGLSTGHPKVKLKVVHGTGAGNVASVAIGLPSGLTFSRTAVVSRKTCTTLKNKKKKCTTTTLIKGLGISGGKAKSVALKGGKLVVTLSKAASSVTFSLSGPLVSESKALQTKVKKHKTKTLTFTLKVTDAKKVASTVAAKLAAH
jgi:hypothetical protein